MTEETCAAYGEAITDPNDPTKVTYVVLCPRARNNTCGARPLLGTKGMKKAEYLVPPSEKMMTNAAGEIVRRVQKFCSRG